VIELQAGATFVGNFWLKARPDNSQEWITIRSSAASWQLPAEGQRVSPAFAAAMPKVLSYNVSPAIRTESRAHHYRIIGVEVSTTPTVTLNYDLILLGTVGAGQTTMGEVPHHIILDRVYVHGRPGVSVRCVASTPRPRR
jgi:hypothetical protein